MPQASEEQRKEWGTDGGCGEEKAIAYLKDKGYKLTKGWCWIKPTPDHEVTQEEGGAISFLINEWDFGGCITQEEYDEHERKTAEIKANYIASKDTDFSSPWG